MDRGLRCPKLLHRDGLQREGCQDTAAARLFPLPPIIPAHPSLRSPGLSTAARSEVLAEGQADGRTWRALC